MTLLMALIYFLAGIICIHRPVQLLAWLGNALQRTTKAEAPAWLKGRSALFIVRLIGFLALLNAVMLFYTTSYRQ
jgi:hypothetical protein